MLNRRDLLAMGASVPMLRAAAPPTPPVVIARAPAYDGELGRTLSSMFRALGGAARLVRNRTVTLKLNLTGNPAVRFEGLALGRTHCTHPATAMAMVKVLDDAGARRIRVVESAWGTGGPLEEYLARSGWDVNALKSVSGKLELENTNALGLGKRYARLKVPDGGYTYPAFDVNHSYEDTDVLVSMAKLKNHTTCGITLSLKNLFGITPASIYGDDAGVDAPNERPTGVRFEVCHYGKRQPSRSAPAEHDPHTDRDSGYRMPRIVADLAVTRPVDIAFIDGVEALAGVQGPWLPGGKMVKPGVLILGTNGVATDAVAMAVMGYNPRARRGARPFQSCDNMLLLAEARGAGSADLRRIEVRGVPVEEVRYEFR
jgi:uncharacterized protein (DUF362 family)